MAKCPSCGADVSASDKRCSKCGEKLDNKKSNPSSKLIIGIIAAVAVLVIVGAFASGIFTGDSSSNSDTSADDSDSSQSTEYWASIKADKFHLPDCEWAQKISEDNKIVYDSREDAISDGMEPCGVCNP